MNILQVIGTLDPAYGGPVEALRQMSDALEELEHRVEVVALDEPGIFWAEGFPGKVHLLGPGQMKYRYTPRMIPWLMTHLKRFDAVIACGIWQYQSLAVRQAARATGVPYFVFVHGALDPWFKRRFPLKHIKKWLYWPWAEYRVLRDASAVLFCSEEERCRARRSFWLYRASEAVVDNGIKAPSGDPDAQREAFLCSYPFLRDKRVWLFMGRIAPQKGCDLLIKGFAEAAGGIPDVHLVMAGPDSLGWKGELEGLAKQLGADRVTWTGMLSGDLRWGAIHAAEVFILPSHMENFGLVVVEALACGVPALISDKANIWREIEREGAGLVATDTLAGTIELLTQWLNLSAEERQRMRERARACFYAHFEIHKAAKRLVEVIESRLSTAKPGSVRNTLNAQQGRRL